MPADFFPNPIFGGIYIGCVLVFAWVCAWHDARTMRIPNALTYSMALVGLPVNLVRGGWLGSDPSRSLWLFEETSTGLGIADGFLFSLAGFATGFAILFVMWILRTCGGGDVKLFAALGAWLGPMTVIRVLGVSLPVLLVLVIIKLATGGRSPTAAEATEAGDKRSQSQKKSDKPTVPQIRLAYSLPVAISLLIVLAWEFRVEIGFFS